jgi:chemotaxis protein MotB
VPRYLAIAVLLLGACVPKARYQDALAEQESLRVQVDGLETRNAQLTDTLTRLKTELEASEAALEETNRKLAAKVAEAGELQEDVEEMRAALQDAEMRKARADAALREYRDLVTRFQALIDAGTLQVKVIDGKMVVELATDILFAPGSATLSPEGRRAVHDVATVLASIPERHYQVSGHTDSVPIATDRFPSNWHLGSGRAISVVELLVESGLSPDRVSASSYSEYQPVDTNRTKEGRAANRRIEIIVVPDLSTLPGYDELEALTEGAD